MNQAAAARKIETDIGRFYADLYGFIMYAYPWSEKGSLLEKFDGPEHWVKDVADEICEQVLKNNFDGFTPVPVIQVAVASGNGCAKSAFAAMIANWIMSTRPMTQMTVMANTGTQLRTKTWPQMEKWTQLSINRDWWEIGSESIMHKASRRKWAMNAVTWSLQNTQAVAGQHSRDSSSVYIFDEASRIPEEIMEQADGGLTDGEPFWIMLGNPTNRQGRLFRAVFGNLRKEYIHRTIDSRTCKYTNKAQIAKWVEERGEDSDWVRAHVKGLAPNADELQFIDNLRVAEARRRLIPDSDKNDPLIMSIDFARGGTANNVIGYRRGRDARSIPAKRISGEKTRDTTLMVSLIVEEIFSRKPDVVFGDATGIGGPIMDRVRQLIKNIPIIDIVNAGKSADERYGNIRAHCWSNMKEWLPGGCIEDDELLEIDLTGPGFYHRKDKLMLESKEDMEENGYASPDWGDQLAMTFAPFHVAPKQKKPTPVRQPMRRAASGRGWMRK